MLSRLANAARTSGGAVTRTALRQPTARFMSSEDDAPTAEDLAALQDKFREEPEAAAAVFSSSSELTSGLRSTIRIRDFTIKADEPHGLGGTDTAPNPVEILLGAL